MSTAEIRQFLDDWDKSGEIRTSLYYRLLAVWVERTKEGGTK